ncbi:MAG TPA: hypothetical protein VGK04_01940 [Thermoanaerobaculia bacterium]
MRIRVLAAVALLLCAAADAAVDREAARRAFDAFTLNCLRDDGALWGVSLCGNIAIVDRNTREAVESPGWVEKLPENIGIANTAFDYRGTRWSMIVWPLPKDEGARDRLLLHERFHAIQSRIGLPMSSPAANAHLDTLEGRYLMRLEMRALRKAVLALGKSLDEARGALRDALAFRRARFERFQTAAESEGALDRNEGMAEYTAFRLYTTDRARMLDAAAQALSAGETSDAFARSYAYASGPAWGLLLDEFRPDWRKEIAEPKTFEQLLAKQTGKTIALDRRAQRYGAAKLRAEERKRDEDRRVRIASYVARFIDGPVLKIPLIEFNMQMDPYDVHPFENRGTVYEHITISDRWGKIVVDKGALISSDFKTLTVVAPPSGAWTLTLTPGWQTVPATRSGDFIVQKAR